MYLTTSPNVVSTSGILDPMVELVDGGSGDLGGLLQSLAKLGWSGVTTRDVLTTLPRVYKEYLEEVIVRTSPLAGAQTILDCSASSLVRLRERGVSRSSSKRKIPLPKSTSGGRRLRRRVLISASCEESWRVRSSNLSLMRDVNSTKKYCETPQMMAVERDAGVAKLHGQVAEICSRFDERGEKLKATTSVAGARAKEVKGYQATLHLFKDKLMEEGQHIIDWKVKHAQTVAQLDNMDGARAKLCLVMRIVECSTVLSSNITVATRGE